MYFLLPLRWCIIIFYVKGAIKGGMFLTKATFWDIFIHSNMWSNLVPKREREAASYCDGYSLGNPDPVV